MIRINAGYRRPATVTIMNAIEQTTPAADRPLGMLPIGQALQAQTTAASPFDALAARRVGLVMFCALLRSLPNTGPAVTQALAQDIAGYLTGEFPALILEEEEGILPRLRLRLLLGDNLDDIIDQLIEEHREDRQHACELARRCVAFADESEDDWPELCAALADFAERLRRHMAWEDATILPMARERLTAEDLLSWRADMDRRYGKSTFQRTPAGQH